MVGRFASGSHRIAARGRRKSNSILPVGTGSMAPGLETPDSATRISVALVSEFITDSKLGPKTAEVTNGVVMCGFESMFVSEDSTISGMDANDCSSYVRFT